MKRMLALALLFWLLKSGPAFAFCFQDAGTRYQIDPLILKAIAMQESRLNPGAVNINRNKAGRTLSVDYGLMQINSLHLPALMSSGIIASRYDLLHNPCLNIQIGAWILAKHRQICGISWNCLGSFNAGFALKNEQRRIVYARSIYRIYRHLLLNQP